MEKSQKLTNSIDLSRKAYTKCMFWRATTTDTIIFKKPITFLNCYNLGRGKKLIV